MQKMGMGNGKSTVMWQWEWEWLLFRACQNSHRSTRCECNL